MMPPKRLAEMLAAGLSGSRLHFSDLLGAGKLVLGRPYAFLQPLMQQLLDHFGEGRRPRTRRVATFLSSNTLLEKAALTLRFPNLTNVEPHPQMLPADGIPSTWRVPSLLSIGEVASWLGEDYGHLQWFADARLMERKHPHGPLRNYRYRWVAKRDGGARLVESPKLRLKQIQSRILREILDFMPPHHAAHGFRAGRSILSFAEPHVGQPIVLRIDLEDFFPRIPRWRVMALFMNAGYPETIAALLANLCCNTTPQDVLLESPASTLDGNRHWWARKRYAQPHLPQGAPSSPALANLCAFRLDRRIAGLARASGANYTRYADDLVFSGGEDFSRGAARFSSNVAAIALEEGFQVNHRKTRLMPSSVSQHAAGLVLNEKLNLPRHDFDALKATLHNCARHGPDSQNFSQFPDFRAHLSGRVAHWLRVHPQRGQRLQDLLAKINWIKEC